MKISKKSQNEIVSEMKQNNVKKLNAGQKREQITSMLDSLLEASKATKIEIIKKLVDSL